MGGITTTLFQRPRDPQFNNTTLLLSGNFPTNGAQNNTFLDSSSNGFSITRNGNTTQGTFSPFSQTGWSNYFNGTSDYLTATNSGFVATGDFTVEAWVYGTQTGAFQGIFVSSDGADTAGFRIAIENTNALGFWLNGTSNTGTTFLFNQWNHVAMVRSGTSTNNVSCYFNGTRVAQFTNTASTTNSTIAIGRYRTTGTNQYWFGGYISNARLVTGAALYSGATITVPTSPLAVAGSGVTQLLTCQSNRFIDNSSSPSTITVNGTPSIQAFSPFVPSGAYTTTAVGGSGYFDGTSDYLTAPSGASISGSGAFTCEFWYYMTVSQNDRYIMAGGTDTFSVGVSGNGNMFYGKSGVGNVYSGSGLPTAINQWVHVVVGKNSSSTYRIWVNGASISTGSDSFTYTAGTAYVGISAALTNPITGYITGLRTASVDIYGVSNTTITVPTAPRTNTSNTQLLLNFTNAGIVDSTAKNVLETVGNAQISTAVSRFGGSSMSFDGTGDYLIPNAGTTDLFAFGTGDFTIEMWLYPASVSAVSLYDSRPAATNGNYLQVAIVSGQLVLFLNNAIILQAGTISTNTWTHIAVSRSGTSLRGFVNGTQVGSTITNSTSLLNAAQRPVIGTNGNTLTVDNFNGYIDDLRVTKGVARYTANFNVPTIGFTDR